MENWKEIKLGDVCSFQEGYVNPTQTHPEYFDGKVKWLRATDLNNSFVYETSRTLTQQGFESAGKSAILFKPDTICISKSGTIGRLGILKDFMCGNRAVINIAPNSDVNFRFIFYVLLNMQNSFEYLAVGSVQKNLYVPILADICFNLPPLPTQQKIAQILSSLDDKIELNNKINANLEQQAQALFKSWFVDDTSELEEIEIGKMNILITDYVANGSFKDLADNVKYLTFETENVLIRLTDFNNNYSSDMVYISDESYNFLEKSKLYGDEIIISNVGINVGTVFRCPRLEKKMSLAPNSIMIRGGIYEHYLYLYFSSQYGKGQLKSIVTGSAQPKFNKTNFRSLKINVPSEKKVHDFNLIYEPIYNKIVNNQKENKKLSNLRDTLLPKLMNGEIEV